MRQALSALQRLCGRRVSSDLHEEAYRLLDLIEALHPGRAVELRIPFVGAVQILEGTSHRRGTPPAVVEMDAETWVRVATGQQSWAGAEANGQIDASGERADLSGILPLT